MAQHGARAEREKGEPAQRHGQHSVCVGSDKQAQKRVNECGLRYDCVERCRASSSTKHHDEVDGWRPARAVRVTTQATDRTATRSNSGRRRNAQRCRQKQAVRPPAIDSRPHKRLRRLRGARGRGGGARGGGGVEGGGGGREGARARPGGAGEAEALEGGRRGEGSSTRTSWLKHVPCHCERSEAIQAAVPTSDCFVAIAPRNDNYAACATALPLKVSPALPAETETFSPSLMRPERMSSDNGSCTDFWMARLSGRAP